MSLSPEDHIRALEDAIWCYPHLARQNMEAYAKIHGRAEMLVDVALKPEFFGILRGTTLGAPLGNSPERVKALESARLYPEAVEARELAQAHGSFSQTLRVQAEVTRRERKQWVREHNTSTIPPTGLKRDERENDWELER